MYIHANAGTNCLLTIYNNVHNIQCGYILYINVVSCYEHVKYRYMYITVPLAHLSQWKLQYLESLHPFSNTDATLRCHNLGRGKRGEVGVWILNAIVPLAMASNWMHYLIIHLLMQCRHNRIRGVVIPVLTLTHAGRYPRFSCPSSRPLSRSANYVCMLRL